MIALVLGAGGLLGRHVVDGLKAGAPPGGVRALSRAACDIRDPIAIRRAIEGANTVFNCAAFTDVDGAETRREEAFAVNALGAENVARAAEAAGAMLVHVSTDFVFAGSDERALVEDDAPCPLSVYGESKAEGERRCTATSSRLLLARVQSLYGAGGRNFASRLPALLAAGGPLRIDAERRVQPTWAALAARQLVRLARMGALGTFHVACAGETTWAGFATELARLLGVVPRFEAVPTASLAPAARRPARSVLACTHLDRAGLEDLPDWRVALASFVAGAGGGA